MPGQLVSRYAAARLLGRDRQTVERAVRTLAPDAYQKGQPRWRLERIAEILAMSPQQRREAGRAVDRYSIRSAKLDGMRNLLTPGRRPAAEKPTLAQLDPYIGEITFEDDGHERASAAPARPR